MLAPIRSSHRTIRNKGEPSDLDSLLLLPTFQTNPPERKEKSEHTKKTRELVDGISNGTVPAGGRPPGELVGSYIATPSTLVFSLLSFPRPGSNERKWRQRRRLLHRWVSIHILRQKRQMGAPSGRKMTPYQHTSDSFFKQNNKSPIHLALHFLH